MKQRSLAFEVVTLAFANGPRASVNISADGIHDVSASDFKRVLREARTRAQLLELADFYQARRKMWVGRALRDLDQLESADLSGAGDRPSDLRSAEAARMSYQHHLRQAAKSAAHSIRYYRRAGAIPCSC